MRAGHRRQDFIRRRQVIPIGVLEGSGKWNGDRKWFKIIKV